MRGKESRQGQVPGGGLALESSRAGETGESGSGCEQVMLAVPPLKAEFLHGFLMESIGRTALLSPATFLNENQFVNILFVNIISPSFPRPSLRQGNQTWCLSEIPNFF